MYKIMMRTIWGASKPYQRPSWNVDRLLILGHVACPYLDVLPVGAIRPSRPEYDPLTITLRIPHPEIFQSFLSIKRSKVPPNIAAAWVTVGAIDLP